MISAARLLMSCSVILTGCDTVRTAGVTTFHVLDTPARFVRDRIDPPQTTTTTTTTTESYGTSDVVTPGRPVSPRPQTSPSAETRIATQDRETPADHQTPNSVTGTTGASRKPSPAATPRAVATKTAEFQTARPVPGKPGYVYSIDPKGGIIDVTGYKTGDKAKDPYSKQIFIVP